MQYQTVALECRAFSLFKHTGKLAWMVHFITHMLAGERFSGAQIDQGEELIDADLCKRVFNLSHSIWYRMNMVPRFHLSARRKTPIVPTPAWRSRLSPSSRRSARCARDPRGEP